jgi:hypothetical protein
MKRNKVTVGDCFLVGISIGAAGMVGLTGIVLCIFIVPIPLGLALLVLAGKIPQRAIKRITDKADAAQAEQVRLQEEAANKQALMDVIAVPEEDLPWLL